MADDDSLSDEEVADPSRYVMPVVPDDLGLDPLLVALVHCAAFLDLADDDLLDADAAGDVLEHVGLYVQRLPPERLTELSEQLERLSAHAKEQSWPEWMVGFVADFLYSCGIGEDRDEAEPE